MGVGRQFDLVEVFRTRRQSLQWSPDVSTLVCIGVQADSSCGFLQRFSPPEKLPQKLVFRFEWLSLLTKGRNTNREPVHMDADKTAIDWAR